jgi:hypothetical protein
LNNCLKDINYQDKWDYQVITYLRDLETRYNCTGLCKPQTFHLFTSYQSGPNTDPCFYRIADELESDMGKLGYVFLSCGTFVFCAWFCQFGLCFRNKEEKVIREHLRMKKLAIQ